MSEGTNRSFRSRSIVCAIASASALLAATTRSGGCPIHGDLFFGVVPTAGDTSLTGSFDPDLAASIGGPYAASLASDQSVSADAALSAAPVQAWKLNLTNNYGHSALAAMNPYVSTTLTDVQSVSYDSGYVYIKHTDVPSYDIGRTDGNNPGYAANQNKVTRITRTPTIATTHATTPQGPIGVMANGGLLFNPGDARSYNNAGVWNQNANVVEASTYDMGPGHSAPSNTTPPGSTTPGVYHYHESPTALINQIDPGNSGQHHSPIIGYAFDGFPIYGPYGYSDPTNPNSAIKRITSSYALRSDLATNGAGRHTLADGTTLTSNKWGPDVSSTYPAGYYLQDYAYTSGSGDLNEYNVRWTVTPEYPEGTWAYFATVDASGNPAYPYLVGPKAWGVLDSYNLGPTGGTGTIPSTATALKLGDVNLDGATSFDDLLVLAKHYNTSGATLWSQGDLDRDGSVGFTDLLYLAKNYTSSASSSDVASAEAFAQDWALAQSIVPEPGVAAFGLGGLLLRRRR